MDKAIERLKKVYNVYDKRAVILRAVSGNTCSSFYNGFSGFSNFNLDDAGIVRIISSINNLKTNNQNAQLFSCPLIY